MANISGSGGSVKISETVVIGIDEWSMDYNIDTFDITEFADTAPTHKSTVVGLKQATGSFSGGITTGATGILGDSGLTLGGTVDLWLETDGNDKYDLPTAIITGYSTSVTVDGEARVTCSFISTSTVTPTFS